MGRRFLVLVLAGIATLAVAGPVGAASGSARMGEANERYFFAPKTTYVNVGGSVTWTNGTDVPHTVSSDSGGELDSGNVADAATFSHTFNTVGTFRYHCAIHPYMTASVVVLAAGVTPPQTSTVDTSGGSGGLPVGLLGVAALSIAGAALVLHRLRTGRPLPVRTRN